MRFRYLNLKLYFYFKYRDKVVSDDCKFEFSCEKPQSPANVKPYNGVCPTSRVFI